MPTIRLLLALLGAAGEVRAHASLRATLAAPPGRIEFAFSEPVAPLVLALGTAAGTEIAVRVEPLGDGSRLVLVSAEPLAGGSYLVRWRVVSVDGQPVAGRLAFAVGGMPSFGPPEVPTAAPVVLLVRALHLATTRLGGGAVVALLLLPLDPAVAGRSRRLARTLLLASLPAAIARLAGTGQDASGLPALALFAAEPGQAALATGTLPALATSASGALVLTAAAGHPAAPPPLPAGLGLLLLAGGFARTGRTATAPPASLFAPAPVLHVLAAMAWLGALVPLALSLRHDPPAAAVLGCFSERTLAIVPLPLAIGLVLAMCQLPDAGGLVGGPWGRILLARLALLADLLAVAAVNRFRLVPRLAAGDEAAGPALRRLLAATAGLGTTMPPRLLAAAVGQEIRLADGPLAARLDVVPATAGWNRLTVHLEAATPAPLEVLLRLVAEDGTHRTDPLLLVPAGTWRLVVGVLLDPFTRVELEGRLVLPETDRLSLDSNRTGEPR